MEDDFMSWTQDIDLEDLNLSIEDYIEKLEQEDARCYENMSIKR